jgi:hypothetical protein
MRVTALSMLPGSPIRKSSDHSSVDSSPRHIAASHVLHRLLVPRHPPCALTNLATKMLASTVQFSKNGRPHPHAQDPPPPGPVSWNEWSVPQPTPNPPKGQTRGRWPPKKQQNRSLRTQQRVIQNQVNTTVPVPPPPHHPKAARQRVLNTRRPYPASRSQRSTPLSNPGRHEHPTTRPHTQWDAP